MRRLKEILVGLDGSGPAFHALKESMRLASWSRGRVTVITVAPSYEGDLSLVGVKDPKAAIDGPSGAIVAMALQMAEAAGTDIRVIREKGETHEKIAERAREGRFDVVALGLEPCRTLRQRLFGSMHTRLAPLVPADILVIPHGSELSWERSLYLDWLPEPTPKAFSRAVKICAAHGSELHSAHMAIPRPRFAEITFFEPVAPPSAPRGSPTSPTGDTSDVPRQVSKHSERSADLSKVIGPHLRARRIGLFFLPYRVRRGIGGWLARRFLEGMIAESPCPIMILPCSA